MVRFVLTFILLMSSAQADLFDFDSDKSSVESKIPELVEKLKSLNMKDNPEYEDNFNKTVKAIENGMEEEKLYCSGEATNNEGKTLPPKQKQLCMRELKKHYIEASMTIFDMKKKYLAFIHQKQLEKLDEVQKKLKADIEKNF